MVGAVLVFRDVTEEYAAQLDDLLAKIAAGKFVVLAVGAPEASLPAAVGAVAVSAVAADNDRYEPGHLYLIRPDAYVAMSVGAADADTIIAELRRIAA